MTGCGVVLLLQSNKQIKDMLQKTNKPGYYRDINLGQQKAKKKNDT